MRLPCFFRGAEFRPSDRENSESAQIVAISRGNPDPEEANTGTLSQYQRTRNGTEILLQEEPYFVIGRPWYQQGEQLWEAEVEAGWTENPYCDQSTKRPAITAFRSVGSGSNFQGVLGSDFLFDDIRTFLSELLSQLNVNGGYILVIDQKTNRLLVSTAVDDSSKKCDPEQPLTAADFESENSTVNALLSELTNLNPAAAPKKLINVQNENYYFSSTQVTDPYGLNLSVVIAIPKSNFTAGIDASTRTTVLLAIATLLLTGSLAWLISRWISRPVMALESATQELAASIDHPKVSESPVSSIEIDNPSELHALANTFNAVSGRLVRTLSKFGYFVPESFLEILGYQRKDIGKIERGTYREVKKMTILFSDIRSFTQLSEDMTAEESFKFINGYLDKMEPAIRNNNGFIDKYIGDAIMALFDGHDSAERAAKAALGMLQALKEFNATRNTINRPPIKIGIGLHSGKEVTLGILGGESRWDTTVIGRDVNKASRVEGLTKPYQASLLVSKEFIQELQVIYPDDLLQLYPHRYVGTESVRGIKEPVDIYEIYAADNFDLRKGKDRTQALFGAGLEAYHQQNYELALDKFEQVLADCPEDGAAQLYVQRCRENLG